MTTEVEEMMPTKAVAKVFSVTTETARHWITRGYFPNAVQINGQWRIPKSDVVALAKERHG